MHGNIIYVYYRCFGYVLLIPFSFPFPFLSFFYIIFVQLFFLLLTNEFYVIFPLNETSHLYLYIEIYIMCVFVSECVYSSFSLCSTFFYQFSIPRISADFINVLKNKSKKFISWRKFFPFVSYSLSLCYFFPFFFFRP